MNDAFDAIKQEFDAIVGEVEVVKGQKDEVEVKCEWLFFFRIVESSDI